MDLKICCDKKIELESYDKIIDIKADVMKYTIEGQLLNGTISLDGRYRCLDNNEKSYHEEVPFTIVFKNEYYQVNNITISNFKQYDIVNVGLECNFEIIVEYNNYYEKESNNNLDTNVNDNCNFNAIYTDEEINKDNVECKSDESPQNLFHDTDSLEEETDIHENKLNNQDNLDNLNNLNNSDNLENLNDLNSINNIDLEDECDAIDEIKDKYESLLNEIFDKREADRTEPILLNNTKEYNTKECNTEYNIDNNIKKDIDNNIKKDIENVEKDKVLLSDIKDPEKVNLCNMKEKNSTITIYFINHEKEVERVCKEEKISINIIYNNACNKDFVNKKRIIIN